MERVTDFILLDSKVTTGGDYKHEIKRYQLHALTNLDGILKSKDITLLTKVCLVKAMVFQVIIYRRERGGFSPWVGEIPRRGKRPSTPVLVPDFMFWGSKITADGDCSHEIKRRLLLGRKVMTNLDSIFKSRDITWPTKVRLVKAYGFSSSHVWM